VEVVVQPPQQLQQVLQALQVLRPHAQLPQPQESHLPKVQQMGASSWPYEFVLAGLELPDFSQLGAFSNKAINRMYLTGSHVPQHRSYSPNIFGSNK